MSDYLLTCIEKCMESTIKMLKKVNEETADLQITSFPDTIRWNTMHTYACTEVLLFTHNGHKSNMPAKYREIFAVYGANKDKIIEYKDFTPPTIDEIIKLIEEQNLRIRKEYVGKLGEKLENPVETPSKSGVFYTVEELLLKVYSHDSFHEGILSRYISIIG